MLILLNTSRAVATLALMLLATRPVLAHNEAPKLSDETAIYQLVLSEAPAHVDKSLVVPMTTVPSTEIIRTLGYAIPAKTRHNLPAGLLSNFANRNRTPSALPRLQSKVPLIYVTRGDLDRIFKLGFWEAFHKTYHNASGTAEFSRPGFARNNTVALVYFTHSEAGLSGSGDIYYLVKVSGHWKIKRRLGGWVS